MNREKNTTRKQEMRAQRRRRQRMQRLATILVIGGIALTIVGFLVAPSLRAAFAPVGEFVQVTPVPKPMADGTAMGDPNAPVLVEVFEDFQCIACVQFSETTEDQLAETYVANGQVRYVYRHYPFIGRESTQAANASMCATEQDMFWPYHDIVYANFTGSNQGNFSDKRLQAFAESLGLNMDEFNACFRENRYQAQINADKAEGDARGVTGTPSVFVNGQQVRPGFIPSFADMQQAIDAALSGN